MQHQMINKSGMIISIQILVSSTIEPKEILGLSVVKKVIKNQLTKVAVNCK